MNLQKLAEKYLSEYYETYTRNVDIFLGTYWTITKLTENHALVFLLTGKNFTEYKIVPISFYKRDIRYRKLLPSAKISRSYDRKVLLSIEEKHTTLHRNLKNDILKWENK